MKLDVLLQVSVLLGVYIVSVSAGSKCYNANERCYSWFRDKEEERVTICGKNDKVRGKCQQSCGLCCGNDKSFRFKVSGKEKSCNWLEKGSSKKKIRDKKKKYCDKALSGNFVIVKEACAEACGTCMAFVPKLESPSTTTSTRTTVEPSASPIRSKKSASRCTDDTRFYAGNEHKTCDWIASSSEYHYGRMCSRTYIQKACRQTCRKCCDNDETYTFKVSNGSDRKCFWLQKQDKMKREKYCENSYISVKCPLSCGVCKKESSSSPSPKPTLNPTKISTNAPSIRRIPTYNPTVPHTVYPSSSPTKRVTSGPTPSPTTLSSISQTKSSTISPTLSPTTLRIATPSTSPSSSPSQGPTSSPTRSPNVSLSGVPTVYPTLTPTMPPSNSPTDVVTSSPTISPTLLPTTLPSSSPTNRPTGSPTTFPSKLPSTSPTQLPSTLPSDFPTEVSSVAPTMTAMPTATPTIPPTVIGTFAPSNSMQPSTSPSSSPSLGPTSTPTRSPSVSLSSFPTVSTSSTPVAAPSNVPNTSSTFKTSNCEVVATLTFDEYSFEDTNYYYYHNDDLIVQKRGSDEKCSITSTETDYCEHSKWDGALKYETDDYYVSEETVSIYNAAGTDFDIKVEHYFTESEALKYYTYGYAWPGVLSVKVNGIEYEETWTRDIVEGVKTHYAYEYYENGEMITGYYPNPEYDALLTVQMKCSDDCDCTFTKTD